LRPRLCSLLTLCARWIGTASMSDKVNADVLAALVKLELQNERLQAEVQYWKSRYADLCLEGAMTELVKEAGLE